MSNSEGSAPLSSPPPSTPADPASPPDSGWYGRHRAVVAIAVALIVFVAVAAVIWFLRSSDSSPSGDATPAPGSSNTSSTGPNVVPGIRAEIVSLAKLRELAGGAGHPVFWAGPRPDARIEFTRTTDGSTYVRYLTGSAKAGVRRAGYVVVATYPQPDAYARVTAIARRQNLGIEKLGGGAVAVTKPGSLRNIYVVYRGKPYQVEVFAPTQSAARQLVVSGAVAPVVP